MNEDQYYQVPDQDEVSESVAEEEDVGIDQGYIEKEILWATELAKLFEGITD